MKTILDTTLTCFNNCHPDSIRTGIISINETFSEVNWQHFCLSIENVSIAVGRGRWCFCGRGDAVYLISNENGVMHMKDQFYLQWICVRALSANRVRRGNDGTGIDDGEHNVNVDAEMLPQLCERWLMEYTYCIWKWLNVCKQPSHKYTLVWRTKNFWKCWRANKK